MQDSRVFEAMIDELRAGTIEQSQALADTIRQFLVETVSTTGGHIGANLGTVELALALDRVFGSADDRVIWDTGHQGYTHKILTGRAHLFASLNTYGGLNRFLSRCEDESDVIEASHAGTSLSVALGLALARRLTGQPGWVVAVVGDGALTEGMLLEALNHASSEGPLPLIVVLNDNGYAISPGFGALHNYLQSRPLGVTAADTLFAGLGYTYTGPFDGHELPALCDALEEAKSGCGERVRILHVKTEKGRGLPAARGHPYRMHFSFPFDPDTGQALVQNAVRGYQDVAAEVIAAEMGRDDRIVCITPSTRYATGLESVFEAYPDRCYDPGMEEQHAMTLSVGLSLGGLVPVLFYQSTFMQRAYDQLFHDVCFMNLPTLLLSVRVGFAGYDNPTHHGIYETSYLRSLPNLRILYPKDGYELERMVRESLRGLRGPTLVEMPYGPVDLVDARVLEESAESFAAPEVLHPGEDLAIVAVGPRFKDAAAARVLLEEQGISCGLVNLRYLKPLPDSALLSLMREVPRVVVVEEGVLEGGVGSAVASLIADYGLGTQLLRVGLPCAFIEPGSAHELAIAYGLDAPALALRIRERWPSLGE